MASVARALSVFKKTDVVWVSRFRTKDGDGIIQTAERERQNLKAVVVDAPLKVLILMNDGSIGSEVCDCYFAGLPLTKTGERIDVDDTLEFNGKEWAVRIPGNRSEGGYFKATVKRITRRGLQP